MSLRLPIRFPNARPSESLEATRLLGALGGAAALTDLGGAILAANGAWRAGVGGGRRLPGGEGGLFTAFGEARRTGRGQGTLRIGAGETAVSVAALGEALFLLQLIAPPVSAPAAGPAPPPPEPAHGLDAFAAAAPFGAALIAGDDPFAGEIIEANGALAAITDGAGRAGATLGELMTPASAADAKAAHAAGRRGPIEVTLAGKPQRAAQLYLGSAKEGVLAFLLDVTESKQMQLQLAQRNKMEAIGQLAGGVAHDFNNMLTAIRLRADELLLRHSLGDPSYESLTGIRQTVERAAEMVRQLLTFSRKATIQRESLDLGEALTNVDVLLRRLLREDVKLVTDYGRNLPRVRVDRAQLESAVMNLVVNARDAVSQVGGGTIRLRTARLTQAEAFALGYAGLAMGEMGLIEVSDDGPGVPPDSLASIFEPFFTTKPVGEGTGLGLATVYGIVKQSDGWITVASPPGEGATFRIFLPVHVPPLALEPLAGGAKPRGVARDLSGAGRILFVEDEPLVRGVAARLLRARGYEVIEAADGEEALELAERHAGAIDLMISDVIMPGIDGPTLLKKARPFLGAAPVMFISGYAEAEFSDLLEGEAGVTFLPKPLDIKTLAERVKAQLRPSVP